MADKKKEPVMGPKKNKNIGFKFSPQLTKDLYVYLNTRPMAEVETIIGPMFEQCDTTDPRVLYTEESVTNLVRYLQTKCPRIDVKGFIARIGNKEKPELLQYEITPGPEEPKKAE
jgi:hypothetical protein